MTDETDEGDETASGSDAGATAGSIYYWPEQRPPSTLDAVETRCTSCEATWIVHRVMAGHTLTCRCGSAVSVPTAEEAPDGSSIPALIEGLDETTAPIDGESKEFEPEAHPSSHELRASASALPAATDGDRLTSDPLSPFSSDAELQTLPREARKLVQKSAADDAPLQESRLMQTWRSRNPETGTGDLRLATYDVQRRWNNRTILEIFLVMLAILGPSVAYYFVQTDENVYRALPFLSLISALLLLPVCLSNPELSFRPLRRTKARYFVEAIAMAALFVAVASFYVEIFSESFGGDRDPIAELVETLGLPLAVAVMAVSPAVLEEIGFRGLLLGRLVVMGGVVQGILISGAGFALAHGGLTPAFPIHGAIGVYLAILRLRSGSLLPPMLMHLLYNGTLIVLSTQ